MKAETVHFSHCRTQELKIVPGKYKGSIFSYLKRMRKGHRKEGLMEAGRDGD